MSHPSPPDLLVPHPLRVLGHASAGAVAALRSLPSTVVEETLEDARALGLVTRSASAGPRPGT